MPGSSIWLLPPPTHHLHEKLKTLIAETLPALFPAESTSATLSPDFFVPHVTLTSEISPDLYGSDPQGWLDSIPWPAADEVCVRFEELRSQDVFVRRCYIGVGFDGVKDIAALARARGVLGEETPADKTAAWLKSWQDAFGPHVSLMYGSVPMDEEKMARVAVAVKDAGIKLTEDGWDGGVLWLVPTDKPIPAWKPLAVRPL